MIAWFALALALLNSLFLLGVSLLALSAWRRVAPTVAPMLSMFAPASAPAGAEQEGGPSRVGPPFDQDAA